MMHLEDGVCSLNLAIKLKELGVNEFCQFYYVLAKSIGNHTFENDVRMIAHISQTSGISKDWISAFTSDELMDLLPAFIDIKKNEPFNNFYLQIKKRSAENIRYIGAYVCDSIPGEEAGNPLFQVQSKIKSHSPKLADCLAGLLILLIENNLLTKEIA